MKGYCEACGRYPGWRERLRGGGLALTQDRTLHVCPECRRSLVPVTGVGLKTAGAIPPLPRYKFGALGLLAVLTVAVAFASAIREAPVTGGVLGAVRTGPGESPIDSPRSVANPSPSVSLAAPSPGDASPEIAAKEPTLAVGRAAIRTWKDSFGRSRLQVILPVRNEDSRWVRLTEATSTYRVLDDGREVAHGGFMPLPALIGPGQTAYLVDTLTVPGIELRRSLAAESDVVVAPTDPPSFELSITDLRLANGIGGGVRATGRVHNQGAVPTRRVIVGVVALDRDGRPLAAVHDTFDIGRVDPGDAKSFATDSQPGGPPIRREVVGALVGVAFESSP